MAASSTRRFALGGVFALASMGPVASLAASPVDSTVEICAASSRCAEATRSFFDGNDDLARLKSKPLEQDGPVSIERNVAAEVLRALTHAQALRRRAAEARKNGNTELAVLLDARFVLLARRFLKGETGSVPNSMVPAARAAYLDLARTLLEEARGGSARRA